MGTERKTALVTGASAGLGQEFAKLCAADGHNVILVARRRDRLEEMAASLKVKTLVIPADLTRPESPQQIYEQVAAAGFQLDFLINNAGFGSTGAFAESDIQRQLEMIDCNVRALTHLTRLFLPGMISRRSGRVLNVGSTAGFVPGPFMATYYATKAFVLSFTEALAYELSGTGVTATVLCPGATATEFAGIAGNNRSALFKRGVAEAGTVAQFGYQAMLSGKVVAVPGIKNKLIVTSSKLSPRSIVRGIAARLNQPAEGTG